MKEYIIEVGGKTYDVKIREKDEEGAAISVASAPVQKEISSPVSSELKAKPAAAASQDAPVSSVKASETKPVAAAGDVTAPMPGKIIAVNVSAGDSVKAGQVLLIMEAMKMETEIVSPSDGIVGSIAIHPNVMVDTGDLLLNIN